jgi:hypothetical protein
MAGASKTILIKNRLHRQGNFKKMRCKAIVYNDLLGGIFGDTLRI